MSRGVIDRIASYVADKLTTKQIYLSNTNMKNGGIVLYKNGNTVTFTCTGDFTRLPTGGVHTYVTLPSGWIPSNLFLFRIINTQGANPIVMYVQTNGNIGFYNYSTAITSATNGGFSGAWTVNS